MLFPRLTPLVKQMLLLLLGCYVAELLLQTWMGIPVFETLALQHDRLGPSTGWQLISYVLVAPPGPAHVLGVLINLVFFWWIVAPFEERYGRKRTAQLCSVTALSASALALVAGLALRHGDPPLYGTGAVTLGAIAAFAYAMRNQGTLSLFGAITMQPMHVVYLVLGISGLFFLASQNFVALVADIGAVAGGIGFVRWLSRPRKRPSGPTRRGKPGRPFVVLQGGNNDDPPRWLN